jgi:acetoacetate decarboxylase
MFLLLDDEPPIAGDYGSVRAATGTMGDKRVGAVQNIYAPKD